METEKHAMTVKSVCEILTNVIEPFGSDPGLSFDHEQLARSVESFILKSHSWGRDTTSDTCEEARITRDKYRMALHSMSSGIHRRFQCPGFPF